MRLGSDPEVFLTKQGQFKSVIGLIGAGKENPLQIEGMEKGYTLQEDNVSLEFGIPPAANADQFVEHIQSVLQAGLQHCKGFSFSKLSCVIFPEEEMQHPMAHIFGCEPDFNAWTGEENTKPQPPHPFLRSAGGHIHVETTLPKRPVIMSADLFLGVPSILMDKEEKRRLLYGKAGACRYKPYGVEYRTLSNFWVFDERYIRWAWRNMERAVATIEKDKEFWVNNPFDVLVQDCINTSDKKLAKQLIREFNLEVV